ncbi:hypothetical protein PsorP6_006008 [Peronosclerospora sorghi]|uniref:Uncharacterized protein n=1 Tax=Peronosclerospora sorghi TaxID=230839 RepID=A0ACC0W7M1_9STRA|nr:hypothetical protein PsorP6_006008 [Peronosclerospora sorghi]
MPSSEESALRLNVWTLEEFGDLVMAWELATFRSRDNNAQNLHEAVYKHFVALRGGSSRRNKAALTSKRSALKFSYLFVRDFDLEQKALNGTMFFELPEPKRLELLTQWKKVNSSVVEITPAMFQALGRIMSREGDEEVIPPLRRRPKELHEVTEAAKIDIRPTRTPTASNGTVTSEVPTEKSKRKQLVPARTVVSKPWSFEETMQFIKAWSIAAQMVCESLTEAPTSIVHELQKQFEVLRGGKSGRTLSGLAAQRQVLKQSYMRIAAFDKIQEMKGDSKFSELSMITRQNLIRSWKSANLMDLPLKIYRELSEVIPLDTRAAALEDMRRAKVGTTSITHRGQTGRTLARPSKKQKLMTGAHDSHDAASAPDGSDEVKVATLTMVDQSGSKEYNEEKAAGISNRNNYFTMKRTSSAEYLANNRSPSMSGSTYPSLASAMKPGIDALVCTAKTTVGVAQPAASTVLPFSQTAQFANNEISDSVQTNTNKVIPSGGEFYDVEKKGPLFHDRKDNVVAALDTRKQPVKNDVPVFSEVNNRVSKDSARVADSEERDGIKMGLSALSYDRWAMSPKVTKEPQVDGNLAIVSKVDHTCERNVNATTKSASYAMDSEQWVDKKRKFHVDGPNGLLWENEELQILINAWEIAANRVCNSDPAERLSLNREMYREFVEMQGGSSVRNSTALAARRSSLRFSHAHIQSFNESQKAKGEPSYHEIPEDTRMTSLRSWKNRNCVDLTKEMYEALGRIFAMDKKLAEVRSLRPPPQPKTKKHTKHFMNAAYESEANHVSKTPKWTPEESSDLIKACADVMNASSDGDLSAADREAQIYDAFVTRRGSVGDKDVPLRRDLKSMAQQWQYVLASYSYIKAYNENCSEGDSPSWFEMSPVQKRAYQQCTNVPPKFVDLDAEMFELVTKTSFLEGTTLPLVSPVSKDPAEGISLRPRLARKKMDSLWSSDSDSSESSVRGSRAKRNKKEALVIKKGNSWPVEEIRTLIRAWQEASGLIKCSNMSSALETTFALFTKLQNGPLNQNRTLSSVRNKMIALKSSFTIISNFLAERGDRVAWFRMTPEERISEIRGLKNKTVMDLDEDMFKLMEQIIERKRSGTHEKSGKLKLHSKLSPAGALTKRKKEYDSNKAHAGQKSEKYVAANWSKEELLMLGEACGELLEGRRSRRYVFEEEKERFYRRYEELGGQNSLAAAVGLARFVLDSYEFIYFYDLKAAETNSVSWFELEAADRDPIVRRMGKAYRSFNGLNTVDREIFDVIDRIDAELRMKLGETKKKTYKPPNDAASSRYVDIEAVVNQCHFIRTKNGAWKKETDQSSSDEEAKSTSSEYTEKSASSSDSNAEVESRSEAEAEHGRHTRSPRRAIRRRSVTRHSIVPRKSKAIANSGGSSTLCITEIIQKQNRKLEEAVKRFRKESADARREHHAFLVQKIQDSFPVDTGNGSYLERVAERQGQTLVVIFQKLQQQRDAEKVKDDELTRQLFFRNGV